MTHFDLVVIGSGPAGHKAAIQGRKAGKSVLLVERARGVGGECVRHGTIPSKTLRQTARELASVRRRLAHVTSVELSDDVKVENLMARLAQVTKAHEGYLAKQLERNAVEFKRGKARFDGPHELAIEDVRGACEKVTFDFAVVAVGSRPRNPPNVPVDHEHVLDSDSCLSLEYLPRSLIVLGAGVIACEYASMFASLGVAVTILDKNTRPLGFLDEETSVRYAAYFATHAGCAFRGGAELARVQWDGASQVEVALKDGAVLKADKVLCALGRTANVAALALDKAGVKMTDRGYVAVDEHGRTSALHIYAAGDVVGPPALASASMDQGRRAVRHAFGLPLGPSPDTIPAGLFTIPEIATVGLTEAQAKERHGGAICGSAQFSELARAHIDGVTDGYLKLVADADGRRLLGAQIFGEGATELIHLAQMAMVAEQEVDVFVESIFNFPTLGEAYRVAALAIAAQREALAVR